MKTKTSTVHLGSIKVNERNPRTISKDAFEKLKASIKRDPAFMELRPIVCDVSDRTILGGTQRFRACAALGMTEVPASWVRFGKFTADQRKRFIIVDNAPDGMSGENDFDILSSDYDFDELKDLGFSENELGTFTADGIDAPALKDGDRAPFRQATFTLHDEQWEEIEAAISKAKQQGGGESAVNENSNGNALAWICGRFNRG